MSLLTFNSNARVLAPRRCVAASSGFCWAEETASPLPLPGQRRSPGAGIRSPKGSWMMPPPPERVGASSESPQKRHRCTAAAAGARPQPRTPRPRSHACATKPPSRARASRRRDAPSLARLAPALAARELTTFPRWKAWETKRIKSRFQVPASLVPLVSGFP